MLSDRDYNYLANQVYEVDPSKNSTPWEEGDEFGDYGKIYKVLKTTDLPNGMQAMAVAPIDAAGHVD